MYQMASEKLCFIYSLNLGNRNEHAELYDAVILHESHMVHFYTLHPAISTLIN